MEQPFYTTSYKPFATFLNEAAFSPKKLAHVKKLIVKVLERKTGYKFYPYGKDGMRSFTSAGQIKTGMMYFLGNTLKACRFNWTKKWGNEIESIDIWDESGPIDRPTVHIDLRNKNIIQVIDIVVRMIKNPQVGIHQIAINESISTINGIKSMFKLTNRDLELFETRKLSDEVQQFINHAGMSADEYKIKTTKKSPGYDQKVINAKNTFVRKMKAGKIAKTDIKGTMAVVVTKGKGEVIHDKEADKLQAKLEERIPPDVLFKDLEELLDLVIKGIQPSILITGMAGVGKSKIVELMLAKHHKSKGTDYVVIKGASSPFGLYSALFLNRKKIVIFDDTDSVFKDDKAVNILKAALDSNDVREVSWFSKATLDKHPDEITQDDTDAGKYPNQFEFEGQIIFISNLHQSMIDPAVKSRSFTIDITLTEEEMIIRMQALLIKVRPDLKEKFKQEVLDALKQSGVASDKIMNMRSLLNGIRIKEGGSSRWKELTLRYA